MEKEKQELYCHECGMYVQFELDLGLNGNHVLKCPNCNHEHCRVVKNGKITDERWDSRNNTYSVSYATFSTSSLCLYSTDSTGYMVGSWFNSSSTYCGTATA